MLQQDWAPAHEPQAMIGLCQRLFPGFWAGFERHRLFGLVDLEGQDLRELNQVNR